MDRKGYGAQNEIEARYEDRLFDGAVLRLLTCEINAASMAVMLMLFKAGPCHVQQGQQLHRDKKQGECQTKFFLHSGQVHSIEH